jgi:hypothetical protein
MRKSAATAKSNHYRLNGIKMAANTVTQEYLMGIKEGRELLNKYGTEQIMIEERIDNLNRTIKGFAASSPVGQMLRGERDFWTNQKKKVLAQNVKA